MTRGILGGAVLAALFCLVVPAAADEKADNALKEIDDKLAKVKSYIQKTKMRTLGNQGQPGYSMESETTTTTEFVRRGEKVLMRNEGKMEYVQTMDGKTTRTKMPYLVIYDGDFSYTLTESAGKNTFFKSPQPSTKYSDLYTGNEQWATIKLLPDTEVGGKKCYVFEMRSKPTEGAPPPGRTVMYCQKENGIMVKSDGFDASGKQTFSTETTDLKVNVDISGDRFKLPADAQIMDMGNLGQQPPPTKADADEEQPKKEEPKEAGKKEKKKPKKPELPKMPKLW
jgi:outer membrane lipoprotein-sorting protein